MKNWLANLNTWWPTRDRQMTPEDIAEACEKAADILEGNWGQGHWWDGATYCIEGALGAALDLDYADMDGDSHHRQALLDCPVYQAVIETHNERTLAEEEPYFIDENAMPNWNDADGRTEQEVLDLLHATAKRVLGVEA